MIKKGKYDLSWECIGCGALYLGEVLIEKDIEHLEPDPLSITCVLCEMHNDVGLIPMKEDRETPGGKKIQFDHEDFKEWLKDIEVSLSNKLGEIQYLNYELKGNALIETIHDHYKGDTRRVALKGDVLKTSISQKVDMQKTCPKCSTPLETNYYPFEKGYQDSCPNTECDYISELYAKNCFGTCDLTKAICWLCSQKDECKKEKKSSKGSDKVEVIRDRIQTIRDVMDETGFVDPEIEEALNTIDSLLTDLEAEN